MTAPLKSISIDELSADAQAALAVVQASPRPLRISDGNDIVAVMMRPGQYECLKHDLKLLRHLLAGELDIDNGDVRDLESVMAAADELFKGKVQQVRTDSQADDPDSSQCQDAP